MAYIQVYNFLGGTGTYQKTDTYYSSESSALAGTFSDAVGVYTIYDIVSDGTWWVAMRDKNNINDKIAKSVIVNCNNTTTTTTTTESATTTTTTTLTTTTTTTTIYIPLVECLNGLNIETMTIYDATSIPYLASGYNVPSGFTYGHQCNRALYEVFGNGIYVGDSKLNNANGSITSGSQTTHGTYICGDYKNYVGGTPMAGPSWNNTTGVNYTARYSKITLTSEQALAIASGSTSGSTISFSLVSAMSTYSCSCDNTTSPHSQVTWIRITNASGGLLYNGAPTNFIATLDVCYVVTGITTTTTTEVPLTTTTTTCGSVGINWQFISDGSGDGMYIYINNGDSIIHTGANNSGTICNLTYGDTVKTEVYPGSRDYAHLLVDNTNVANCGAEPEYITYTTNYVGMPLNITGVTNNTEWITTTTTTTIAITTTTTTVPFLSGVSYSLTSGYDSISLVSSCTGSTSTHYFNSTSLSLVTKVWNDLTPTDYGDTGYYTHNSSGLYWNKATATVTYLGNVC